MRTRIALLLLALSELLVAGLVVHAPDVNAAFGFLRGDYPSSAGVLAASSLLVWVALLVATTVLLLSLIRRGAARVVPSRVLVAAVLAGSVVVLGTGIDRRLSAPSYSMCCGSVTRAERALETPP